MATDGQMMTSAGGSRWTLFLWGGSALLLSVPFIAMRFTNEVNWSAADFAMMGIMLGMACGAIELVVRLSGNMAYRLGVATAVGAAFLITWANLAVGIVGSEHNPANLLFFGALLIGFAGAIIVRFRARGMALAMLVTAAAVVVAFVIAVIGPSDEPSVSNARELVAISVIACPLFLSAWLFRRASR